VAKEITVSRARSLLTYDGVSGEIRRRTSSPHEAKGEVATGIVYQKKAKPWLYVSVDRKTHAASKIAWMLAYGQVPPYPVRFVNGDTTDVRLSNLALDIPPPDILTSEEVRRRFDYEPATGLLRLRVPTRKNASGTVIGHRPGRYGSISIAKKRYPTHVVVWMHQWGAVPEGMVIDHINGDPSDNRIENLRLATHSQNRVNWQKPRRNASGVRGVVRCSRDGRWKAEIKFNGARINIGRFDTKEQAAAARRAKELEIHGEFARPD
jgi:ribosomal protein S14